MLTRRIIACLDVRDGRVVKGVHFEGLRGAGDPATLARRYASEGIDEVVVLDITATLEGRRALLETIRAVSRELVTRRFAAPGETLILTMGELSGVSGGTNTMKILEVAP